MNYEFPLVFFTVFSQLGVGIAIMNAWKAHQISIIDHPRFDWAICFIATCIGLVASLFHLGDPFRAGTALANLANSWLSREGLVFGAFAGLAFVNIFINNRVLQILTAVIGIAGIIMQGMTYAPVSMPAISNGVPLLFFALSALVLGSAFTKYNDDRAVTRVRNVLTVAFLIVLIILPCVWASGNALTVATAKAWATSIPFWAGLVCMVVALVMSYKEKRCIAMKVIMLLGVLLVRLTFFGETLHTATRIGMPF